MLRKMCPVVLILGLAANALQASEIRTWTDSQGNQVNAKFLGMNDGIVVLLQGIKKIRVPLTELSQEDQVYVQQALEQREREEAKRPGTSGDADSLGPEIQAVIDAIPRPSQELLEEDLLRIWTDTQGNLATARFVRVDEKGQVTLRDEAGRTRQFPLSLFICEDLEFIRDRIALDAKREVFPKGELVPLTPEQLADGETTWTDRNGIQVNGKVVGRSGSDKVIIVSGERRLTVPIKGLLQADQARIDAELARYQAIVQAEADRRRAEQERQRAESQRRRAEQMQRYTQSSRPQTNPYSNTPSYTPPSIPTYEPPEYEMPSFEYVYEFHCDRCGHRWTDKTRSFMYCPKCSGSRSSNSNYVSDNSSSTQSSSSDNGNKSPRSYAELIAKFVFGFIILGGIGFLIERFLL